MVEKGASATSSLITRPDERASAYVDEESAPGPPSYGTGSSWSDSRTYVRPEPAWKRFLCALLVALLIFVASTLTPKLFKHTYEHHGGDAKDWPEFRAGEVLGCIEWSLSPETILSENESDVSVLVPTQFSNDEHDDSVPSLEPPYHASYDFSLSPDVDAVHLLARGQYAYGNVRVESGDTDGGKIKVNVNVAYWKENALKRALICRLSKPPLSKLAHGPHLAERSMMQIENGLGIFTPHLSRGSPGRDALRFDITLRMPGLNASDAAVPALSTEFANFKHELEGALTFPTVFVKTSNARIHAKDLSAERAVLKTSNAPITGNYKTSHKLELETSNAPISVDVGMFSDGRQPTLLLRTSNGLISSSLGLYNTTPDSTGSFVVHSRTSNAPSSLSVYAHPAFAPLSLASTTSNNHASVSLHPAYVGRFTLSTSIAAATVHASKDAIDSSGEGRERQVRTDSKRVGFTQGRTWWGNEDGWDGTSREVNVRSSNGRVDLFLPEV